MKVRDPGKGNFHEAQPKFEFGASSQGLAQRGGKTWENAGSAGLFVSDELVDSVVLPTHVTGVVPITALSPNHHQAVYLAGRGYPRVEWRQSDYEVVVPGTLKDLTGH